MSRLRKFKDNMQIPLDLKAYKKMERKELFEEQQKLEDAKQNIFYLKEMEILGEGCVGLVKKVQRISDNKIFASKMVKTQNDEEVILNVIREFKNQRQLKHPNIVEVYELYVDETKGRIYTIMELVEAKEMFDVISKLGHYTESVAAHIFKQILAAIHYLHERMVCHRDLKPNNILCNEDGTLVKITDFNISKFSVYDNNSRKKVPATEKSKQVLMWTYTGTVAFSAPEIFQGDSYDQSVDMWSSGVVLYTMLAGYQPFESEYVQDLIAKIQSGEYTFPDDPFKQISDNAKDLIKQCLQINPLERIKPIQALSHEWILNKQSSQPLHEASSKINLNLTKLVSKFSVYRNLGLIRKIPKRKQTLCPSMLYKYLNSSPNSLRSNSNERDGVQSQVSAFQQEFLCQGKIANSQHNSSQINLNIYSTNIDQNNGCDDHLYQLKSSFCTLQTMQSIQGDSQRITQTGFNTIDPSSSQVTSSSDFDNILSFEDEANHKYLKSQQQLNIFAMSEKKGHHNIIRRKRKHQTNIIFNRYKLNESDQFIVQAIEDDQISCYNTNFHTTQDLSDGESIQNQQNSSIRLETKKLNKTRISSLSNLQTRMYSPQSSNYLSKD